MVKLATAYPNGLRDDAPMIEVESNTGRRFRNKDSIEFINLDDLGNLRLTDEKGKIFAAATPLK